MSSLKCCFTSARERNGYSNEIGEQSLSTKKSYEQFRMNVRAGELVSLLRCARSEKRASTRTSSQFVATFSPGLFIIIECVSVSNAIQALEHQKLYESIALDA